MSRPVVVMPDAVAVTIDYLRPALAAAGRPVHVGARVPSPRPSEFVRVERIGGLRKNVVSDSPRLDIHCWAATDEAALDLAQLARALVHAMGGSRSGVAVYRVQEVGGPMWLPDDTSGQPRYAFAVEIQMRGSKP